MVIRSVKIVNHDGVVANADVEISGSIITKIQPRPGVAQNILVPGFIDVHIHGFKNKDNMESRSAVEFIAAELKKCGTTSFLPTIMTERLDIIKKSLFDVSQAKPSGARILGSHLEGPFIAFAKKGAHNEKYLLKPTKKLLDDLIASSAHTIKKITIAPELFSGELINHLAKQGIVVSVGHSNGTAQDVKMAAQNGATSCTHLWNAMTGVANRDPGVAEGILLSEKIYAEMICDLIHVDPETIALSVQSKGAARIIATTDALKASGMPDGDSISGGLDVTKKGLYITVKGTNTLAGSAATMHDNFVNLIKLGYDEKDVVAMTSYNAACNLGVDLGQVKEGKEADLIIMDRSYKIMQVLVKGE